MEPTAPHAPAHDFDFLHGQWHVHNRRLRERLAGCTEWEAFDAEHACRPVLGGMGNCDEMVTDAFGPHRFIGLSLRLYDPGAREWSIHWADNHRVRLDPPVRGRFVDGVGTFFGRDHHGDVPVLARFTWSGIGPSCARWEQAFSVDDGATWETNWTMDFTRRTP